MARTAVPITEAYANDARGGALSMVTLDDVNDHEWYAQPKDLLIAIGTGTAASGALRIEHQPNSMGRPAAAANGVPGAEAWAADTVMVRLIPEGEGYVRDSDHKVRADVASSQGKVGILRLGGRR